MEADSLKSGSVRHEAARDSGPFGSERSHVNSKSIAPGDKRFDGIRRREEVGLSVGKASEAFCVSREQVNEANNGSKLIDVVSDRDAVRSRNLESMKRTGCGALRVRNHRAEREA